MPDLTVVSYSELDSFRQCPHKHHLQYKERWTGPTRSPALLRGTAWHSILEAHYLSEEYPVLDLDVETLGLLRWMYDGYVEYWGGDADWKILATEWKGEVPLPTPAGYDEPVFAIKVRLDLVVRELSTGNIMVVDHKSGKDLPKRREMDLDDQFGLYVWALRQLGKKVAGAIHNAARTQRNKSKAQPLDERFGRFTMFRTDAELDRIAQEAADTAATAWLYYGDERPAPRSPNPQTCGWRCPFTETCLMGRKGYDERLAMADYEFEQDYARH